MTAGTRRARLLLIACACAVLAYASASPAPGSVLLALLVGLVGVGLTGPRVGLVVPRWIIALVTVVVLVRTLTLALENGLDVHDFAEFVAWMMAVKVFDRRTPSDDAQLLALSVFLCVAAMLVSNALAVAVLSFIYLPCIAYAAMLVQLRTSLERAQRLAARGSGRADVPEVRPAGSVGSAAAMFRTSAVGLLLGFVIAALVFVVLPRGAGLRQFGRWGNPSVGRVVGFADRVRVGAGGAISVSHTPVLHMRVTDADGNPIGGPGAVRYLRGAVLDDYERGIWSASHDPSVVGEKGERVPHQTDALGGSDRDSMMYQHVTLLNTSSEYSYIFTIWRPTEVTYLDFTRSALYRPEGTVMVAGRGGKLRYIARSSAFDRAFLRRQTRPATSWPSPVVRGVAEEVLASVEIEPDPAKRPIGDDSLAINAFRRHFWSRYTYSLDSPAPPPGVEPVDWFLAEGTSGHCEYYASALAALCRSVGIPARVVTGYVAAEYNAATGHYVVRESNAHAWVEAQVEPGVWKTYDATPPSDLLAQHGPEPGLMARAGRALDAINYAWVNSVVSYDGDDRSELLGWIEPLSGAVSGRIGKLLEAARLAPPKVLVSTAVRIVLAILGGAAAAVVAVRLLRRLRRHLARRPRAIPARIADAEIRDRVRTTPLYQEMLEMLRRAGFSKPAWQPPAAWGESLAARSPLLAENVLRLSELYYIMRFGGRALTATERADARRLLGELATALRAGSARQA